MNGFPEKTCSVERLVTVPQDVEKVLNGQKNGDTPEWCLCISG